MLGISHSWVYIKLCYTNYCIHSIVGIKHSINTTQMCKLCGYTAFKKHNNIIMLIFEIRHIEFI